MKTFSAEKIAEFAGLVRNAFDERVNPMPFNLRCAIDIITQLQAENAKLRLLVSDATLALDVNGSPENAHRIQTKLITIIKGK